jgi:hypothetical protein
MRHSSISFKRLTGFDQVRQARSSRMKTKPGGVLGSGNSSAIHATEDGARRPFAAARAESGSTDRTQAASKGRTANQNPVLETPCHSKKRRGQMKTRVDR